MFNNVFDYIINRQQPITNIVNRTTIAQSYYFSILINVI